jgi:hypothetical protein
MPVRHDFSISRLLIIGLAVLLPVFPVAAHNGADAVFSAPQAAAPGTPVVAVSGTVGDLIVDNRVTNTSTRYVLLHLDEGRTLALEGSGLDGLNNGARVAATGQPVGNTFFVTSVSVVAGASTPSAVGATAATATGTLTVFHADYFTQGRGEYGLVIQGSDGRPTQLNLPVIPDTLRAGMMVTAEGTVATNGFALDVSTLTILANPAADFNAIAATATTNNVLVMPIKFSDSPTSDAFSPATISTEFQTKVAPFYQEQSFGQQLLSVTVACYTSTPSGCAAHTSSGGWLLSTSPTPASCNWSSVGTLADAAATAAGYNLANYKNRFYIMPSNSACGWAGLAYIGSPYQAWGNGYYQLWVSGHELGHNFILWHAGSLYCPGTSIGPGCVGNYSVNEYGDPWDVMGNVYPGHFNSMQKSALNWLPSGSVKTHSSGTATYTLSPLENPGQSTYAVTIPAATNRIYWIEYRQPIGFDSGMSSSNGAQIRVGSPFEFPCSGCGGDDTEVLDMTLGTPGTFTDAALLQGQSFTDSQYGITVNVTNVVTGPSGSLTLSVSMSGKGPSTTSLASSANPSVLGASVTLTASVTGSAPTGTVTFTDTGGVAVSGCAPVTLPTGTPSTKTAACTTTSLGFGTHSIVASYSGDAANTSSSSSPLAQVVNMGLTTSTTSLASSANPSMAGSGVTFTATVTGSAPTGTVAFTDSGTTISGCSAVALPTGAPTATCSTSSLIAGTHSIVATYSGDSANTSSTSSALSQVVKTASTTSLASSANPSSVGASVTFTATVTGLSPTGTVAFADNGTTISGCDSVALPSSKTATCSTSSLAAGTHSIVASYSGDAANGSSSSPSLSQVVNGTTASTTNATSSLDPTTFGMPVTFTATVTGVSPTGTVTFSDSGTTIPGCSAVALPAGTPNTKTATCSSSSLAMNRHLIVATYSGDAFNPASASPALVQLIRIPVGKTDFNADGSSDIVWQNAAGANWINAMSGAVVLSSQAVPPPPPGWALAGIGDFNGDKHADLLWRNTADPTQYSIWLMNGATLIGSGQFTVAAGYMPTQIGDFDGDGKADILWENPSGARFITFMNGSAVASSQSLPASAAGWVVVGLGDFNGDGKADLLWNNQANPTQYWIYLMNGASLIGSAGFTVAPGYVPTQIADFDGDGKADILWENGTGNRWIYFMNGTAIGSGQPAPAAAPGWTVAGVGDFNGDGRADLLWQNSAAPNQYWMYLLNGTAIVGGGSVVAAPGYWPLSH